MNRERQFQILLAAGDIVALLLFVLLGQTSHETVSVSNPLGGMFLTGVPFLLAWLVTAFLIGAYRGDIFSSRIMFTRALTAWFIALPIALVLRALVLGRDNIPTSFVLVAFAFGGLFVVGWRMFFVLLVRWRTGAPTE